MCCPSFLQGGCPTLTCRATLGWKLGLGPSWSSTELVRTSPSSTSPSRRMASISSSTWRRGESSPAAIATTKWWLTVNPSTWGSKVPRFTVSRSICCLVKKCAFNKFNLSLNFLDNKSFSTDNCFSLMQKCFKMFQLELFFEYFDCAQNSLQKGQSLSLNSWNIWERDNSTLQQFQWHLSNLVVHLS